MKKTKTCPSNNRTEGWKFPTQGKKAHRNGEVDVFRGALQGRANASRAISPYSRKVQVLFNAKLERNTINVATICTTR